MEGVATPIHSPDRHRTGFFGYRSSFWNRFTTCLHPDNRRLSVGRRLRAIPDPSVSENVLCAWLRNHQIGEGIWRARP